MTTRAPNSQFLPHISVDQSTGTIAVTWYDSRESALNDTARYYGAFSNDGGANLWPELSYRRGDIRSGQDCAGSDLEEERLWGLYGQRLRERATGPCLGR